MIHFVLLDTFGLYLIFLRCINGSGIMDQEKKGYKKLKVWEEAHKLVLLVYKVTEQFPKAELFSLTPQIRRAVVSITANIVEGHVKHSKKEFLHHLDFANGSLVEVEYYFELSRDLGYITDKQYRELEQQRTIVGNLLHGLIRSLKKT